MACGKRADIVAMLKRDYKEVPRARGIAGHINLLEAFTSPSGSWSLLLTQPRGSTCIVGAGHSWEDIPPKPEELPL